MGKFNKVIIAMSDEWTKKLALTGVSKCFSDAQIIDGANDGETYYYLQKPDDNILLIFDRFFMGYILKYKIAFLKTLNEKMKIIFAETGFCVRELGLRLWELGADGFLCNIEKDDVFKEGLNKIASGAKSFPELILDDIKSGTVLNNRRTSMELTDSEYLVAIYLGKGFSPKEISFETGMSIESVRTHSSGLKRKIGLKSMNDLTVLNQRLAKFNIRSWCC